MNEEPDKTFLEGAIELFCAGFFMVGLGGAASQVSKEAWWQIMIGPDLARVESSIRNGSLAQAEADLIGVLRVYPDDPRLNYTAVGLYLLMERPLHANFYRTVYKRLHDTDAGRLNRITAMTSQLQLVVVTALTEAAGRTAELYENLGSSRQYAKLTDVQKVMAAPAAAEIGEAGYFYPENPLPCDANRLCNFSFEGTNLFAAVRSQVARVSDPRGGVECCSLELADRDLRPVETVQEEFVRDLTAAEPGLVMESAEGALRLTQFRSRILMKQMYLLNFAERAAYRTPLDPEPDSRWYVRMAGYVVWAVLAVLLYVSLDGLRRWIFGRSAQA